jgi:hypothetical protein
MYEFNKAHLQGQVWQIFCNFCGKNDPPGQVLYSNNLWIAIWYNKSGTLKKGAILENALKKDLRKLRMGQWKKGKNQWEKILVDNNGNILARIEDCCECGAYY